MENMCNMQDSLKVLGSVDIEALLTTIHTVVSRGAPDGSAFSEKLSLEDFREYFFKGYAKIAGQLSDPAEIVGNLLCLRFILNRSTDESFEKATKPFFEKHHPIDKYGIETTRIACMDDWCSETMGPDAVMRVWGIKPFKSHYSISRERNYECWGLECMVQGIPSKEHFESFVQELECCVPFTHLQILLPDRHTVVAAYCVLEELEAPFCESPEYFCYSEEYLDILEDEEDEDEIRYNEWYETHDVALNWAPGWDLDSFYQALKGGTGV